MTTEVLAGAEWWNRLYGDAEEIPYVWGTANNVEVLELPKQETEAERNERIWKSIQDYSKC
jgi:hypothetical protein